MTTHVEFEFGAVKVSIINETVESVISDMDELMKGMPDIFGAAVTFQQAGLAAQVFSAPVVTAGAPTTRPAKKIAGAPPSADTPSCKHGVMLDLKGGQTKSGEPYKFRYYCDGPKDDKCTLPELKKLGVRD